MGEKKKKLCYSVVTVDLLTPLRAFFCESLSHARIMGENSSEVRRITYTTILWFLSLS